MTSDRSDYVIDIDRLPGSENASRFDGHEHGARISFFISRNRPGTGLSCTDTPTRRRSSSRKGRCASPSARTL
jgi:hypothetical protein